jgi:hypothetical protein
MNGFEQFLLLMGICIGISIGVCALCLFGFLTEMYTFWQLGRYIAVQVTEKNHKRRAELLAKMNELQRAMQQVPPEVPVIESGDGTVTERLLVNQRALPMAKDMLGKSEPASSRREPSASRFSRMMPGV